MTLTSILLLLLQDHKKKKWHSRIEKKFSHIRYVAPSLTLRRSVMHTGQLFPAVCFWKNLIPDAVKYWFSLTSVKALYTLSNKIFLPFWASMNDLTRSPSFHNPVSSIMPVAVVAVIPNRLSLVSLWLREAQRWWSWKLTRQLFLWLRLLLVERVEKWRSPRAR